MSAFVPLRVRSHGSLLWGTASPEALIGRALELGFDALALTDRDNLYLAIRFLEHARAEGISPVLGCEVVHGQGEALLLALDRRGWAHLCAVITARHLDSQFDLVAALAARHSGLHVIVESPGLAASLARAGVPPAQGSSSPTRPARAGGLWLGIRGVARERARIAERAAAARALGIPLVATGDVAMLAAADHEVHRAAVTASAGELIDRMPPGALAAPDAWLAAPAEWERRVRALCAAARVPEAAREALAHNRLVAERCRLELDLGSPIFPSAPLGAGETARGKLAGLGVAGVTWRYPAGSEAARARLDDELEAIERLGFTDYFLLVAEIVGFARARGIPTVGRGSGASSLVAYALGITNVDPIRHGLHFERFLNPQRRDCPDLDIDLCWRRRDEVIAHVYTTYGADRVAMIATHATLGARSAFRETAKALGIPNPRVDALARLIPRDLEPPYRTRLAERPEARGVDWSEPALERALALAERLDGAPRHLSVHSGGVVIADRPLTHYLPLQRAAKDVVITQFEMRAVERIGLVKMDLLGNRALTTIGECVASVRTGRGVAIDVEQLQDPEPLTAARLAAGDTLNCFQLESPAMRHLLQMLDARTLDDTIAAVALVRPGPAEAGMKEAFCRRRRGLEPASFLDPRLEPVLAGTHGVLLYEEDVMRVAAALTGISLAEGDDLRRAIGGAGSETELAALEGGFVALAQRAGVSAETGCAAWRELARFSAYAFCKAHAAGYGALGYQSAYLKSHWPTEYAAAILNHHAGMYATWVHVDDLRRQGVVFLPPCVQRSAWDTGVEAAGQDEPERGVRARGASAAAGTAPGSPVVRVGLGRVMGLSAACGHRIVAARGERPFTSLADLAERARPSLPELEALVLAGALDWTGRTRPTLLLETRVSAKCARLPAAPALVAADGRDVMPEPAAPVAVPDLPEFTLAERVRGEWRATGLWFSAHPLDVCVPAEARRGTLPAAAVATRVGQPVAVLGLACARRGVETRAGHAMLFVTVADPSGIAECVLFPDRYRRFAEAARAAVVRVEGRAQETLGAVTITAERVQGVGTWSPLGDRS